MTDKVAVVAHGGRLGHARTALVADAKRAFGSRLLWVEFTEGAGTAGALATRAIRDGAGAVIAAGGDGTVHEVLQPLKGTGIALGVVPGGSGNDFAFHLGIRGDAGPLLRRLAAGRIESVDRLDVNGLVVATAACWGVSAGVGEDATKLRNKVTNWGKMPRLVKGAVYQVTAAARLLRNVDGIFTMTVAADGRSDRYRAWSAAVGDSRRIGGAFLAFPDATKHDGLANLLVAEKGPWKERMWTAALLGPGLHQARPGVHTARFASAVIEMDRPMTCVADGEILPLQARYEVTVVAGGLPLLLPEPVAPR